MQLLTGSRAQLLPSIHALKRIFQGTQPLWKSTSGGPKRIRRRWSQRKRIDCPRRRKITALISEPLIRESRDKGRKFLSKPVSIQVSPPGGNFSTIFHFSLFPGPPSRNGPFSAMEHPPPLERTLKGPCIYRRFLSRVPLNVFPR